ncbi:MAG: hypothetical protein CME71_09225 [Halobacteriovorax sp.]|nr:hypothetical protein [Halobacteriovorax sp.]
MNISKLFDPISRHEFLEYYLKGTPLVAHGFKGIDILAARPMLNSLEGLIASWPSTVNAYQDGTADEVNSITVSAKEASNLFSQKKSGLYFDDPNRFDPLIEQMLQELRIDLGLSNLTYARSLIYVIAKGKGTAAHFDQNINFVIQVTGSKKWWIATNKSVKNPLVRHTLGHPVDPELESYSGIFPESMPEDATEYILKPGSVLFLPRGCWHKTEALSDAISLNFTYSAPSWLDLISAAIRSRLVHSEAWRETADFVNDPELAPHAVDKFDQLLSELALDAATWKASDILSATESPTSES